MTDKFLNFHTVYHMVHNLTKRSPATNFYSLHCLQSGFATKNVNLLKSFRLLSFNVNLEKSLLKYSHM